MTQKEIKLANPIISGKTEIAVINIRKPLAGDLRGVKFLNFVESDIDSLVKVLPRITSPTITEQDVYAMELADITSIMVAISDFLTPTSSSAKTESQKE